MADPVTSYERAVAVTPSDSTVLDCEGFYVGGAGNVAIVPKRGGTTGTAVTLTACIVGQYYPIACHKIMSTNTTATLVVALY
jgi:hypothetical protein